MYIRIVLIFIFLSSGFLHSVAQAPANDECSGAIAISTTPFGTTCSASVSASTVNATQSSPAPSCAGTTHDDDIWYSFTAASRSVIIRYSDVVYTASGNTGTLSIALYGSSCPSTTAALYCNLVNTSGSGYRIIDGLTPGVTYYLRFWSFGSASAITFNFCVQDVPAPPVNDECINATPVNTQPSGSNCTSGIAVSTAGATQSAPNPSCGSGGINDDVWYSFTANTTAISIRVTNAQSAVSAGTVGIGFALYSGACPATTATFHCDDNIGFGSGTVIVNDLTPGTTYYLRMYSVAANNYATFDFCIEDVIIAANDECANAIPFQVIPFDAICSGVINASTSGGTKSSPNPSCTGTENDDDVWFRFTATSPSVVVRVDNNIINETGAGGHVGYAIYRGACPSGTEAIACNTILSATEHEIVNGLVPGETYFVRFWSTLTNGNTVRFDFCVQEVFPPSNDECINAVPVTPAPVGTSCNSGIHATTTGATRSAVDLPCTNDFNDDDIWYSFTANTSGLRINFSGVTRTIGAPTVGIIGYALYAGPCPATSEVLNCNANIGTNGSVLTGGLVPGQQYFLRFFSYGVNQYVKFDFCLADEDLPLNDDCSSAVELPAGQGFCTNPLVGDMSNATPSAGFGLPACANTATTTDVWYKATIPASGNLVIQTSSVNNHPIDDLVMEAFTGSCGSLSPIVCDDDGNPATGNSASHPRISLTGRTAGEVVYLRVIKKFNLSYGQFAICAWDSTAILPVANGGNCVNGVPVTVNAAHGNNNMWVPVFDGSGNIIAEIFANGNNLDIINSSVFVNTSGTVRNAANFYLDRNITLEPSGTGSARIRLYFRNSEWLTLAAADPAIPGLHGLRVIKTNTGCEPSHSGATVEISPDSTGSYGSDHFLEFSTGSFSSFYIDGGLDALPLEFLSFRAGLQNEQVDLDWTVTEDLTIKHFAIQRSADGNSFVDLSYIPAVDRISMANGAWHYTFTDPAPVQGINFYRIRMISFTGNEVYSRTVAVNTGVINAGRVSLYPNPVSNFLVVKLPVTAPVADVTLFNAGGANVKRYPGLALSNGAFILDMQDLPPGVYFLHVADKEQQYRFKVIKH